MGTGRLTTACTRQGAEEWPSLLVGGQSLRRALQVKPGVVRAIGSPHTPDDFERTIGKWAANVKERVSEGVQIFFSILIGFALVVFIIGGAQRLANWLILPTAH